MNDAIGKASPDRMLERAMAAEARAKELEATLRWERRIRDKDAARLKDALDRLSAAEATAERMRGVLRRVADLDQVVADGLACFLCSANDYRGGGGTEHDEDCPILAAKLLLEEVALRDGLLKVAK